MRYTPKLFVEFLTKLMDFDSEVRAAKEAFSHVLQERSIQEKDEWFQAEISAQQKAKSYVSCVSSLLSDSQNGIRDILKCNLDKKSASFVRIQKCKEALTLIHSAEERITDKAAYNAYGSVPVTPVDAPANITVDRILQGEFNFISMAYAVNEALQGTEKRNLGTVCSKFYNICRSAEAALSKGIVESRAIITQDINSLYAG